MAYDINNTVIHNHFTTTVTFIKLNTNIKNIYYASRIGGILKDHLKSKTRGGEVLTLGSHT